MNWKNEAKDRLRQYKAARCALELLPGQISALEQQLYAPGAARIEGGRKGVHTREDWQINTLMGLSMLRERLSRTAQWVADTDRAVEALEEEQQRILREMVMDRRAGATERLCEALCMEQATLYRRRDQALEDFAVALYGPVQ